MAPAVVHVRGDDQAFELDQLEWGPGWRDGHPVGEDLDHCLALAARQPFELVEFENLTVTPYVDNGRCQGRGRCGARMEFSLRASGLKAARPAAKDVA